MHEYENVFHISQQFCYYCQTDCEWWNGMEPRIESQGGRSVYFIFVDLCKRNENSKNMK